LLSSQFQGFCRDLHTECVNHIVSLAFPNLQPIARTEFLWNRSLGRGNPNPGAIGTDFKRLGIDFWDEVYLQDMRNQRRRELLEELLVWRNAIAHQDFDSVALNGNPILHLSAVRGWRSALNALARSFDQTMCQYLQSLLGANPW